MVEASSIPLDRILRFLRRNQPGHPDECWEYQGHRLPKGYGLAYLGGGNGAQRYYAHRVAYEAFVGEIPDGMFVCHRCDNPPCWNPAHLFVGTQADNLRDMVSKGRALTGERNPRAKLTASCAKKIIRMYESGMSQCAVADELGVSAACVGAIVRGDRWGMRDSRMDYSHRRRGKPALDEFQVSRIRAEFLGHHSERAIARMFGVSPVVIGKVRRGESPYDY